ncbi:MAG: SOS response-associated peptidase [Nitrospirota bacterium]|nr:SOS response-associated peptidase [Nitrospirota bacterium]MDH5588158.1 SOS response-associated peptidase [Nitrospirota bacterium]MDH5775714.1 SOS response-associated peptidase [Nitrospirota bacterium]
MCGRFTRKGNFQQLAQLLGISSFPASPPRYNIAPSQMIACVRTNPESQENECVELKWGLVPSWAKDPSIGHKMINARAETVAEKPSFRKAFQQRRCLILADGFYEWKREGKAKQPYYIHFADNRPFAFAGLWERWGKDGNPSLESCAIITTGPNALMASIHHRMPVILHPKDYASWLGSMGQDFSTPNAMLQPHLSESLEAYPVSPLVNNPRHDTLSCLQPLE